MINFIVCLFVLLLFVSFLLLSLLLPVLLDCKKTFYLRVAWSSVSFYAQVSDREKKDEFPSHW